MDRLILKVLRIINSLAWKLNYQRLIYYTQKKIFDYIDYVHGPSQLAELYAYLRNNKKPKK